MKMKFGLEEDINIEVSEGNSPEEALADQEANEAVEEAAEGVDEVVDMGFNICEIIDNLTSLRAHVKKFGVTKQMLHLVNANNQLGNAINITLPYYEDDDEANDIDESDIPSEEVVMEGFADGIKKAKDAVVKFFKMIWEKLKEWWGILSDRAGTYKKTHEKMLAALGDDDEKALKSKKAKLVAFDKFIARIETVMKSMDAVAETEINDEANIVNYEGINKGLIFFGKEIAASQHSFDIVNYSGANPLKAADEGSFGEKGWKPSAVKSKKQIIKNAIDKLQDRKIEKSIKRMEQKALKNVSSDTGDKKVDKENESVIRKNITKSASITIKAHQILSKGLTGFIGQYIKICNAIPSGK